MCPHACRGEACFLPPSCNGITNTCGSNVSCCLSYPVYGGSFDRSCYSTCGCDQGPFPARVATFALDAFEVTVGRFKSFVRQYETALPATDSGKNSNNSEDTGWRAEWNQYLPSTREALEEQLNSCDTTWNGREDLPVNCVSWYLAQAFCIWDGGRLPTQAEWNYAASGGDEQRTFPWSSPPASTVLDDTYAAYGEGEALPPGPVPVGTHPKGAGRWLQEDLSGNVWEWVFDDHEPCYSTPTSCNNCGQASAAAVQKVVRGGAFWDFASDVMVSGRTNTSGEAGTTDFGFRCARNL
jgi:formylglycine-generating enzyme required for sulfatase activity